MFQTRGYRAWVKGRDLAAYSVRLKETDLYIRTTSDLSAEALSIVKKHRDALEGYIKTHPFFAASFEPLEVEPDAPRIVELMAWAGYKAGVGPMAAVAGAFSQLVGQELALLSREVIIENGGDNYLQSSIERVTAIYAGTSPLSGKIGLIFRPDDMPCGVCTSSATVGPSISLGKTDATTIVAPSAALADAAASAVGNVVKSREDIPAALELAQKIEGVTGALIIIGEHMGAWGRIEICRMEGES